jgi:hypothetical protein
MSLNFAINWLCDRLLEQYPELRAATFQNGWTARGMLQARICWGIPKGFSYFWTDVSGPYGAILIRPVNQELIEGSAKDYWNTITDFDLAGDICWVDFAYGPGLYPRMLALCRSTGVPKIGWQHRQRIHIVPFARMPLTKMKHAFHIS